ncbi:hypothetical protein HDV00_012449 [Rhizophlyctis rosea]|nr:hypothetical protein HDV00_012449 [Rhizophlyctis rosea]
MLLTVSFTSVNATYVADDGPVIGIDFGSVQSLVAISQNDTVTYIANIPSYVAITNNGTILVGHEAELYSLTNPQNAIYGIKHLLARRFDDTVVQEHMKRVPFRIVEGERGMAYVAISVHGEEKIFSPQLLATVVLTKLKVLAEGVMKKEIKHAVLTVPADFNDAQRQAMKDAGTSAGFKVERIINEPTAASIAYQLHKQCEPNILVVDLGGTTLDATVLIVDDGVFEILGSGSDASFGDKDIIDTFVNHFVQLYRNETSLHPTHDNLAMQKLNMAVEQAVITLNSNKSSTSAQLRIPWFHNNHSLSQTLSRETFNTLTADYLANITKVIDQSLLLAQMSKSELNHTVIIGHPPYISLVTHLLEDYFDGNVPPVSEGIHPELAVVTGAAIQAAILTGDHRVEPCLGWITALSLGIKTSNGLMAKVVSRNSMNFLRTRTFTTAKDNQTSVLIEIYEGERPWAKYNRLIRTLELTGIKPAPAEAPRIEVTFDFRPYGVNLKVSATDLGSGRSQFVEFGYDEHLDNLGPEGIEKGIRDAEEFWEVDEEDWELMRANERVEGFMYALGDGSPVGIVIDGNADQGVMNEMGIKHDEL